MTMTTRLFHVFFEGAYYTCVWARDAKQAIDKVKPSDWNSDGFTAEAA